ncbi:MAG: 3'-5' exonuclease [Leptolyngbyaceae cyanobacterium SL_1_1]|nr:3'-5' exonuclease [Leptolyngbyaceae cyanobacterium RM1_1_2]NJO10560.1 3'-5' exonuclease [Leptolyngbyaceae cyanobacterium SL_1_1]
MVLHRQSARGQSALLSTELLAYYRQVSHARLSVVDVETTGSLADKARVIEVSVLQASLADGIQQQQTHLINPGVRIPAQITRITGITQPMIELAIAPEAIWPQYQTLLSTGVLTAHNLAFDYSFLQSEYQRLGIDYGRSPDQQFCTVLLSRLMLADLPSRRLPDLVEHFGFDVSTSHRAAADTLACWYLAKHLLHQIQQEPDESLLKQFGRQWMRLKDAAKLLKRRQQEAYALLEAANLEVRLSYRSQKPLYRRGDVERVLWQQQGQQLSLL